MSIVSLRRLTGQRRGLTLVELVVVMAILIALAGIIIPILPGIIGRAETSARATNDSEIYKWIQTYEATNSQYPYDWDSLLDFSSGSPVAPTYAQGFTTPKTSTTLGPTGPALTTTTLTTGQAGALTGGGIVSYQMMSNSTSSGLTGSSGIYAYSDTFNPYPTSDRSADRVNIASGSTVVVLTAIGQQQLGLADNSSVSVTDGSTTVPGTGWYVVFGLGSAAAWSVPARPMSLLTFSTSFHSTRVRRVAMRDTAWCSRLAV